MRNIAIGVEDDNLVEQIVFKGVHTLGDAQLVTLNWVLADDPTIGDIVTLTAVGDGYAWDVTNTITQYGGRRANVYIRVTSGDVVWSSKSFAVKVAALPDVDGTAIFTPAVIDRLLAAIAANRTDLKRGVPQYRPTRRPLVTFIDDDGYNEVMTVLRPVFDAKEVPCCCSIMAGYIDKTQTHMPSSDIKSLVDSGWEMLGHGNSYTSNLSEFPVDADLEYQLGAGCQTVIEGITGERVNGFVYPQNYHTKRIRNFTKKYYDYAFGGYGLNTADYIDSMRIKRIAFGAWTSTNPTVNGNAEKNTLDYYKACVDNVFAANGWLVFMMHCYDAANGYDAAQQAILPELIDYIKSLNVDIVTARDGYEVHGNQIFIGDTDDDFIIGNDRGLFTPDRIDTTRYRTVRAVKNSILPSAPVTDFPDRTITTCEIDYATAVANSLPGGNGGCLVTYRFSADTTYPNYNKQEYWMYGSEKVYRRSALTSTTWSDWVLVAIEDRIKTTVSLDFGTVPGNTWAERTAALPGLTVNSHVTVTPKYSVNFFYQGVCDANGILTIRVYNLSATAAALSHEFHVLVTN